MSTHNDEAILMSTQNIGFYEDDKNYLSVLIKYHQICTLSLLVMNVYEGYVNLFPLLEWL